MKYRKFIISNYRAITGPLEVNVEKNSLTPIVGVNESGKTTILHAIFAFDFYNDNLNDGRHLKDISNLYALSSKPATIAAEVATTTHELKTVLDGMEAEEGDDAKFTRQLKKYRRKVNELPSSFIIVRNLTTMKYDILAEQFSIKEFNHRLVYEMVRAFLPFTLYFDDFRDSIEDRIEINRAEQGNITGWLAIVERLFNQTQEDYSVFDLPGAEERARKSILSKVQRHLNSTLTKEWQKFQLDDTKALTISIDYKEELTLIPAPEETSETDLSTEAAPKETKRAFLTFDIVETDSNGDEHYFFIRDRSKGFFWFFNFVMKLEFNPKLQDVSDGNTIYLLDEPGSYLHASAQSKLCSKLQQLSLRNKVLYCTHSHYLLNPDMIPFSAIRVAAKDGMGDIKLIPIHEYKGSILEKRSAFQPVIDALQIKPFMLDLTHDRVIIVEGIYDYYGLELFKQQRSVNVLPSVGADSIKFYVSLMIAWQVAYWALWDNDNQGRLALHNARQHFGDEESSKHFHLLPLKKGKATDRILQDLFKGTDVRLIKTELGLPLNSSFQTALTSLFYAPNREDIINKLSPETKQNFEEVFISLGIP